MKIRYIVNQKGAPHFAQRSFMHSSDQIPQIGEHVVRHVEFDVRDPQTSSMENRFVVVNVTHVLETREWYLGHRNHDMCFDAVVELEVIKDD